VIRLVVAVVVTGVILSRWLNSGVRRGGLKGELVASNVVGVVDEWSSASSIGVVGWM
jgi:hypothetical protein